MKTRSPQAQPWTGESKTGRVSPANHRKMGIKSLRTGGQASIKGMDAVRWVPVTTATQVALPKINADGVQCGLQGTLRS